MASIRLRVPSKINLHLRVGTPDADRFHPLRSWFVTTSLCDRLICSVRPGPREIDLRCDDPSIPTDARNLVVRAATRYLEAVRADVRVEFGLAKRIPHGAGLGGGSADAAAALFALDALVGPTVAEPPTLASLAAAIGSDVPFFLGPPSAIATGRGERLVAAPPPAVGWAVLILPTFGISTPAAYGALDRLRPVAPASALEPFDVDAWARLDAPALAARLVNDLEPAAFSLEPALATLHASAEATLGRPVRMSGSGSTLFAIFDDEATATAGAAALPPDWDRRVVRLAAMTIDTAEESP